MIKRFLVILFIAAFSGSVIYAQEFGFGFAFTDDGEESSSEESFGFAPAAGSSPAVLISGEVSAAIIGYLDEISEGPGNVNTRDMFAFSGKLNFLARTSYAEGVINLRLVPALVPVSIDEAYIRAFFGSFDITAGLRKLSWGKADQFGPLDIINLPDSSKIFTEMADNNSLMSVKIAAPVIHVSYRFGMFSKIEGLFLPSFEITSMAVSSAVNGSSQMLEFVSGPLSDKWMPAQMDDLKILLSNGIKFEDTETNTLDYTQAGLRFTTTIGSADVGIQYFYGRMFQPAVKFIIEAPSDIKFEFIHNKYHQIGLDYAQVLAGFNIRAEFAANITEDIKGDDGLIYNPSLGWSFGFDRDIIAGVNINFQANGSVRLLNDKVGSSKEAFTYVPTLEIIPDYDIEAGTKMTATRLTAMLSKKFLRDELELRAAFVWGIEDMDFAVIPALIWTKDDLRTALSGGFFAGNSDGQLGQYKKNNFLKLSITYMF